MLGADRLDSGHLLRRAGIVGGWGADFGEDVGTHVAAGFRPFVVLLHQHRADKPDDGVAGGEDPDDIGAAADLPVQALFYPALAAGSS